MTQTGTWMKIHDMIYCEYDSDLNRAYRYAEQAVDQIKKDCSDLLNYLNTSDSRIEIDEENATIHVFKHGCETECEYEKLVRSLTTGRSSVPLGLTANLIKTADVLS